MICLAEVMLNDVAPLQEDTNEPTPFWKLRKLRLAARFRALTTIFASSTKEFPIIVVAAAVAVVVCVTVTALICVSI